MSVWSLRLRGAAALFGLWAFYGALFAAMIEAAPQSTATGHQSLAWASLCATLVVGASAALNPWLLDRLLGVSWIPLESAGDVGPFLRDLLEKHGTPAPRLGVVVTADPYALTYGVTRRGARMVVTSGLLELLDVDEQCAIVAHEAAHLVSGDFFFATFFATPMLLLEMVSEFTTGARRAYPPARVDDRGQHGFPDRSAGYLPGGGNGAGFFLMPLSGILVGIYAALYGPLARARERAADGFARPAAGAEHLGRALFQLARALGSAPGAGATRARAHSCRGFAPLDAATAARAATLAAAATGTLEEDALRRTVAENGINPCGGSPLALHPRLAERIGWPPPTTVGSSLVKVAAELHRNHLLLGWTPCFGFALGLAASTGLRGYFGLPLLGWALGRVVYVLFTCVLQRTPLPGGEGGGLSALLAEVPRWWGCSFRATLVGRMAGHGIPNATWSPDAVLQTAEGALPVRLRHPLGVFHRFLQSARLDGMLGQEVELSGWVRARDVPYLEAHRVSSGGQTVFYAGFVPLHLLGSLVIAGLGVLFIVPQWLGL